MIHQVKLLLFVIFTILFLNGMGQDEFARGTNRRIFRSLKEASTVNPDSVFDLRLGNNELKAFPLEVLKYKNLRFLDFNDLPLDIYYDARPDLLTDKEIKKVEKIRAGIKPSRRPLDNEPYPTRHKNRFRRIPKEISSLKKLEVLELNHRILRKKKLAKLQSWLPGCIIDDEQY